MLPEQGRIALSWFVPCAGISYIAAVQYRIKEETMFGSMKKIARAFRAQSIEERELAYLNGSFDRIDLEYRQRQIDRGLFRKTY